MKPVHKEKINRSLIKILYFVSFLLGAASSFIIYLESDYLKVATGSENITYFYIVANILALFIVLNWHHLLRKYGKAKIYLYNLGIKTAVIFLLAVLPVSIFSAWVLAVYMILAVLAWIDLDILLETCSTDKKTGKIRGLYMTIVSAGYLFSPIIVGVLVSRNGFQSAFAAAFLILLVIFLVSLWKLRKIDHYHPPKLSVIQLLDKVKTRKNVLRAYYISFLLEFFYALMVIYTPLYLLNLGFSWFQVGQIFAIMLIPFVLTQYPAGWLMDKYIEEKDVLIFALITTAIPTAFIFFMSSRDFWAWAAVLFCTRVGASLIDVAKESYFYKRIDHRDVDIIDFFRTVRPVAYVVGTFIATPIVFFLHVRFIFPIIALGVLTGFWAARKLASSRIPPLIVNK